MFRSIPPENRSPRRWLSGAVVAMVVAGCGGQQPATTGPVPSQPTQGPPVVQQPTTPQSPAQPNQPRDVKYPGQTGGDNQLTQAYMPFAAGRSWTYQVTSKAGDKQDTGQVTWQVNQASDTVTEVAIQSQVQGQTQTVINKVEKNPDGTVTVTTIANGQEQKQTLKAEEAQGLTPGQPPAQGQMPAGTPDTVTVPAGTFDALKVTTQLPENQGTITAWYAKDIGLVKQEIQAQTEQGALTSMMELSAYQ